MNRLSHVFAAIAAFAIPSLMLAVPADPRPRTLINPDGSTVRVRVHGDEKFNFMTDVDCTTIMHRDENGFFVNTLRDGAPLAFNKANVEMLRAEQGPTIFDREEIQTRSMARMASLNGEGRSNYPTIGNDIRSLVVLVEFQDVDFTVENPKEYFTRQLNEPGFSDYGGQGSARDYFTNVSNGQYTPQFDVYGPVKVSKDASYFKDNNSGNMALLIREAITELHDSGELNLADYDFDQDGILDTVFIYYAGYGSADSKTETIWPHQYDYQYFTWYGAPQLKFDGIKVGPYACANELKGWDPRTGKQSWLDGSTPWVDGIGTFVHEYGHVLGLPDLYDTEYSEKVVTPGDWDVMDQGSYNFDGCMPPMYSAYERWVCRWLEYTDAEDFTHYDLEALASAETPTAVRIRIPMSANGSNFQSEYFIIEARDNTIMGDACFPDSGLMIWRINYKKNLWTSNSVNTQNGCNVEIVYADGPKRPIFTEGAIFPGSDVELIPSKKYSLWKSPVITEINYDKESHIGSFDYNMVEPSDLSTVLHDSPLALADGSRAFTLKWDPVEGAASYQVTVRTVNSGKVVADLDETNVGDVTSIVVGPMSNVYWKLEMEAYVRCVVDGMPSTEISNVITFKPSELERESDPGAVDGIDSEDVVISGGIGCVNAPAEAVIYNAAGSRLNNSGLAPGIYLVSFRGRTSKVLVR